MAEIAAAAHVQRCTRVRVFARVCVSMREFNQPAHVSTMSVLSAHWTGISHRRLQSRIATFLYCLDKNGAAKNGRVSARICDRLNRSPIAGILLKLDSCPFLLHRYKRQQVTMHGPNSFVFIVAAMRAFVRCNTSWLCTGFCTHLINEIESQLE